MKKTKGLTEHHIHGAFGIDFMKCEAQEVNIAAEKLMQKGVGAFFPTIMTADLEIIKERISVIKEAASHNKKDQAFIAGVHLEGPFINPEKAGIHEKNYISPLEIELFKKIEDNIIKTVTLAPELDFSGKFIAYLKSKNIKVFAGHCIASDLTKVDGVTHLYNATGAFSHRGDSTVVSALVDDNLYTEIIADSIHVSDSVLKITFRQKPTDKIILISDALPLAYSDKTEQIFAGETIYKKEGKAVNKDGILAGSLNLLCDIVKNITNKKLLSFENAIKTASKNISDIHKLENTLEITWDDENNIVSVKRI